MRSLTAEDSQHLAPGRARVLVDQLLSMSRRKKQLLLIGLDVVLLPLCLWMAFALRMSDFSSPMLTNFWWVFPWTIITALPLFVRVGMYRAMLRYTGTRSTMVATQVITLHVALLALVVVLGGATGFPRSILGIYWLLCIVLVAGSRPALRGLVQHHIKAQQKPKRTVIFGAGGAGAELAHVLQESWTNIPVAFIDDKSALQGSKVHGLDVYPSARVDEVIAKCRVDELLLAIPSASRVRRREVLSRFEHLPVHIRSVPALKELVSGHSGIGDLRELNPEDVSDLIGRDPVPPDNDLLTPTVLGKSVMVTGAGGSIGSELCRQILAIKPSRIVLFELSETALYEVERELRAAQIARGDSHSEIKITAVLGSVTDTDKTRAIIRACKIQTIYHAAAYKHVPLVEKNPVAGIENNVLGTWNLAREAMAAGVQSFVLVSTDKAVRPTNVMGAAKRLAELAIQGVAGHSYATRFTIVRFGNVLDSSGSVVPLFREQIANGGPVTVTDPEVTRYFMTIPEAASLVIQAASMGQGGDVFVLDMGKPIKVLDIANRLIRLAGLRVRDPGRKSGDIELKFIGLRPGEKLYEELLIGDNPEPTAHPRILRANEGDMEWSRLVSLMAEMASACSNYDSPAILDALQGAVAGYEPQCDIQDPVWLDSVVAGPRPETN